MRFLILIVVSVLLSNLTTGNVFLSEDFVVKYESFFPPDIHKYPIVFKKFQKNGRKFGSDVVVKDKAPEKVNAMIQKFIDTHPEHKHVIVKKDQIDSLPTDTYKYLIQTRFTQFESQASMEKAVTRYRIYKSIFYVTDRTTGKEYALFHTPRQGGAITTSSGLPQYPPSDKQFFKALSDYIAILNGQ